MDPNIYSTVMQASAGDFSAVPMTGVCDTWLNVMGEFGTSQSVEILFDNAMVPHYRIRVRMSALFIDNWDSGDRIILMIDGSSKVSRSYNNFNTVGSNNSICNDTSKR